MINRKDVVEIGKVMKAHGLAGEVNAIIDPEVDIDALGCIVIEIDGILVPFFIEGWRGKGGEACLLKIDGFDSGDSLNSIINKEIYALKKDAPVNEQNDGEIYLSDLVGYTILDNGGNGIGVIEDYDDSTLNVIFMVNTPEGKRLLIPATDEFIIDVDENGRTITMVLPEGILNLN